MGCLRRPFLLHSPSFFLLLLQTLAADKEGLVKLKNSVKDIHKAGNGEYRRSLDDSARDPFVRPKGLRLIFETWKKARNSGRKTRRECAKMRMTQAERESGWRWRWRWLATHTKKWREREKIEAVVVGFRPRWGPKSCK